LAVAEHNLSVVLRKAERLQEAGKVEREALAVREKLVTEFPDTPHYRKELADSLPVWPALTSFAAPGGSRSVVTDPDPLVYGGLMRTCLD
jgi:hypothetical protein